MANLDSSNQSLPTLGWVQGGHFYPLDNISLQTFMDFPMRLWDDFNSSARKKLRNLQYLLPSGRLVPRQVPLVREFDPNWPLEWKEQLWADGRRCFRLEHICEQDEVLEAYNIDSMPAPTFIPQV